jgi:hypothetical protein
VGTATQVGTWVSWAGVLQPVMGRETKERKKSPWGRIGKKRKCGQLLLNFAILYFAITLNDL